MKTFRFGIGADKIAPCTIRFTFDVGMTSSKPSSERVRNVVVTTLVILAAIASLSAVAAYPDVDPTDLDHGISEVRR